MNLNLSRKAQRLTARALIIQQLRLFFINKGYLETDTPLLIPAPAPEAHIDAVKSGCSYLQTSPELCMKRLLAAGYPKLFQISKCWRADERGSKHLPEFSMLEWYRAGADYYDLMHECMELLTTLVAEVNGGMLKYGGFSVNMTGGWEKISVREAFDKFTGTSMESALENDSFDLLMSAAIEPNLGVNQPTIIYDYPAQRAALARLKPEDPSVAERFELYIAGIELANAFSELVDPEIQRKRFIAENDSRRSRNADCYPLPEKFLQELAGMPPSAGIALGVDRLVMLLTGAETIDAVVAFTPEEL